MEYKEIQVRSSKLETNSPNILVDMGTFSSNHYKVIEQTFMWTIYDYILPDGKCRLTSPKISVNFGGVEFDNVQLIFYPRGNHETTDYTSFFLHSPTFRDRYQETMISKVTLSMHSPVKKDSAFAVHMSYLTADNYMGYNQFTRGRIDTVKTLELSCKIITLTGLKVNRPKPQTSERLLLDDMTNLYKTQIMSDVSFKINDVMLRAHKVILSTRSPVFKAMFESNMKEATDNVVHITDVDAETFDKFLLFLYSGKIADVKEDAEELLALAEKYAMADLKAMCETRLVAQLTVANSAQLFIKADLLNANALKAASVQFMKSHLDDVAKTDGWRLAKNEYPRSIIVAFVED